MLGVLALAAILGPGSALFHGTMDPGKAAWGIASGVMFSIGTVLLVAAISLTGMSVAFPICIGLANLIGGGVSWYIEPAVPATPMALGLALILASILADAAAYRAKSGLRHLVECAGIVIAIIGGLFTGAFPPCLQKAMVGTNALDPYAAVVMLGAGILGCTIVTNYGFMRRPLGGDAPVSFAQYFAAPVRFHIFGLLGGILWAAGTVANFVAAGKVSVAISYAFGGGTRSSRRCGGSSCGKSSKAAPPLLLVLARHVADVSRRHRRDRLGEIEHARRLKLRNAANVPSFVPAYSHASRRFITLTTSAPWFPAFQYRRQFGYTDGHG